MTIKSSLVVTILIFIFFLQINSQGFDSFIFVAQWPPTLCRSQHNDASNHHQIPLQFMGYGLNKDNTMINCNKDYAETEVINLKLRKSQITNVCFEQKHFFFPGFTFAKPIECYLARCDKRSQPMVLET